MLHFLKLDRKIYCTKLGLKCSYGDDIIERGPMMRVSFAMDGNT